MFDLPREEQEDSTRGSSRRSRWGVLVVRIPAQLTLLIAQQDGLVDVGVLTRYSALLDRAEQASGRLKGGVEAGDLIQAADAYRYYQQVDTGSAARSASPDLYGYSGARAIKRTAALNVGLRTGLPMDVLGHECLFDTAVAVLIADATEGGCSTAEGVAALLELDAEMASNESATYMDLAGKYENRGIAVDVRGFAERWAKRRSLDGPQRAQAFSADVIRDRAIGFWEVEQANARSERRKARKANAWAALGVIAESRQGSGDDAVIVIDGVQVPKMRFYQWLHRADKAG